MNSGQKLAFFLSSLLISFITKLRKDDDDKWSWPLESTMLMAQLAANQVKLREIPFSFSFYIQLYTHTETECFFNLTNFICRKSLVVLIQSRPLTVVVV